MLRPEQSQSKQFENSIQASGRLERLADDNKYLQIDLTGLRQGKRFDPLAFDLLVRAIDFRVTTHSSNESGDVTRSSTTKPSDYQNQSSHLRVEGYSSLKYIVINHEKRDTLYVFPVSELHRSFLYSLPTELRRAIEIDKTSRIQSAGTIAVEFIELRPSHERVDESKMLSFQTKKRIIGGISSSLDSLTPFRKSEDYKLGELEELLGAHFTIEAYKTR
jgi:hypothetical protein